MDCSEPSPNTRSRTFYQLEAAHVSTHNIRTNQSYDANTITNIAPNDVDYHNDGLLALVPLISTPFELNLVNCCVQRKHIITHIFVMLALYEAIAIATRLFAATAVVLLSLQRIYKPSYARRVVFCRNSSK